MIMSEPKDVVVLIPGCFVSSVALKLYPFWLKATKVFSSQFCIKKVSVEFTLFYHCVDVFPQNIATQVLDLICAPPTSAHRWLETFSTDEKDASPVKDGFIPDFILGGLFLWRLLSDVSSHVLKESLTLGTSSSRAVLVLILTCSLTCWKSLCLLFFWCPPLLLFSLPLPQLSLPQPLLQSAPNPV